MPKARTLALLGLCALFAVQVQGAAPATAETVTWPNRGPYRKVGDPHYGAGIKLPVPVVQALQQTVLGDPSHWLFLYTSDYAGQYQQLLDISSATADLPVHPAGLVWGSACVLVEPQACTLLNTPASLPRLNGLLKPFPAADLHNQDKLKEYLADIIFLHKGQVTFQILTPHDVRYDNAGLKFKLSDWLHGREKRLQVLFDLAEGIRLRQQGDQATARCNIMRFDGSVVAWTCHLRVEGQTVRLEAVDVHQLRKEGTFSYAAV